MQKYSFKLPALALWSIWKQEASPSRPDPSTKAVIYIVEMNKSRMKNPL